MYLTILGFSQKLPGHAQIQDPKSNDAISRKCLKIPIMETKSEVISKIRLHYFFPFTVYWCKNQKNLMVWELKSLADEQTVLITYTLPTVIVGGGA